MWNQYKTFIRMYRIALPIKFEESRVYVTDSTYLKAHPASGLIPLGTIGTQQRILDQNPEWWMGWGEKEGMEGRRWKGRKGGLDEFRGREEGVGWRIMRGVRGEDQRRGDWCDIIFKSQLILSIPLYLGRRRKTNGKIESVILKS